MYKGEVRSPGMVIVLTIVTCGIYGLWWHYKVGQEVNAAAGKEVVNPMFVWLGLVTCGLTLLYFIYTLDKALIDLAAARGKSYTSNLMLWIILYFISGLGMYVEMFQVQTALNEIWEG